MAPTAARASSAALEGARKPAVAAVEAQVEYLKLKGIPGRDPQLTPKQIDLSQFYNATPKESWLNDPELPARGFGRQAEDQSTGARITDLVGAEPAGKVLR